MKLNKYVATFLVPAGEPMLLKEQEKELEALNFYGAALDAENMAIYDGWTLKSIRRANL